ncbi:MAG: hypothetical protein IIC06_08040, partial [Proteobacteria bacterium]|nr:hypothetical protein [Pseudomonadota bacterium]
WIYMLGWQWVMLGGLIIVSVVFFQQGVVGWVQEKWPELFGIEVDEGAVAAALAGPEIDEGPQRGEAAQ